MHHANRFWVLAAAATLGALSLASAPAMAGAASGGTAAADAPATEVIAGTWQHHKVTMNYFGITSLYTCDGLEDHVRQILIYLGARKDAKVSAVGCQGPNTPSRTAWVNADFYSLAPAADAATADTVRAHWAALELKTDRPSFMGAGDCELIEQIKDLTLKNFSLRNLDYRTSCVPHEVVINGFSVTGQALRAAAPAT